MLIALACYRDKWQSWISRQERCCRLVDTTKAAGRIQLEEMQTDLELAKERVKCICELTSVLASFLRETETDDE